jgi:hypothetical protein
MVNKDNRVLNSHEVFRPLSIYNGICIRPTHSWARSKEVLCSSVFALLEREGISGIPKQSQRCAMPVVRMLALYRPQISNIHLSTLVSTEGYALGLDAVSMMIALLLLAAVIPVLS